MILNADKPLARADALTTKANQLALGLEDGAADLLELVTPTKAELLHWWWFGQDMVDARAGLNFHPGPRQAILNAIVAHEVLGAGYEQCSLQNLYEQIAPDALPDGAHRGCDLFGGNQGAAAGEPPECATQAPCGAGLV
ncbi:MAG: hypothetical protein ACH34Y_03060 [Brachymonas sp.]